MLRASVAARRLAGVYDSQLVSHPLRTKVFSSGLVAMLGDFLAQRIEQRRPCSSQEHDFERSARIVLWFSCGSAISGHFWYTYIVDWLVPSKGRTALLTKIMLDEFVYTPPLHALFFFSQAKMQGKSYSQATDSVHARFLPTLISGWVF